MQPFKPGFVFKDRWEIRGVIGSGETGCVYDAYDSRLTLPVAIKVMPKVSDQQLAEARVLARVNHENVVRFYAVEVHDGSLVVVMEKLDGQDLRHVFRQYGPLPPHEMMPLLMQAARGMDAAHRAQVIHRDLKPENIFITPGNRVKVLDFNIARAAAKATERLHGTPLYLSPEQCQGAPATVRSDIYALCTVGYEGMYGHPITIGMSEINQIGITHRQIFYTPAPLSTMNPDIPELVSNFIDCGLSKAPEFRFSSAAVMANEAEAVLSRIPRNAAYWAKLGVPTRDLSVRKAATDVRDMTPIGTPPPARQVFTGPGATLRVIRPADMTLPIPPRNVPSAAAASGGAPSGAGGAAARPATEGESNVTESGKVNTVRATPVAKSSVFQHYGVDRAGEIVEFARDQLKGYSLREMFSERAPVAYAEMMDISLQVQRVLAAAHRRGEVHGNICPENVFIIPGQTPVVLNFGEVEHNERKARAEGAEQVPSNPLYVSPDWITGMGYGPSHDIYSLATLMYEGMLGQHPARLFTKDMSTESLLKFHIREELPLLNELSPQVPEWVARYVECALMKDPSERFPTMAEMLESGAAQLLRDQRAISTKPSSANSRTPNENLEASPASREELASRPEFVPAHTPPTPQARLGNKTDPKRSVAREKSVAKEKHNSASRLTPAPVITSIPERSTWQWTGLRVTIAALAAGMLAGAAYAALSSPAEVAEEATAPAAAPAAIPVKNEEAASSPGQMASSAPAPAAVERVTQALSASSAQVEPVKPPELKAAQPKAKAATKPAAVSPATQTEPSAPGNKSRSEIVEPVWRSQMKRTEP